MFSQTPTHALETAIASTIQTFARWVATPQTNSARLAVGRVAECVVLGRPWREGNPLFLHGAPGTGKTHLVAALAYEIALRKPELTIVHRAAQEVDAEPQAVEESDLLILEDMQHLPRSAAETLVQFLDVGLARRRQLVFTATVGPGQLTHLPARLTSRLASGLVAALTPLSASGRLAFLQDRAQRRQLAVSRDVLTWLAEHLSGSVRHLEGAIARLETLVRLHDRIPDLAMVVAHFQAEVEEDRPTVERIAARVGRHFDVEPRLLQSRRQAHNALVPRQIAMCLARRLTPLSLEQIGAYFGGRDHSTVLHACRKIEQGRDAVLTGIVRQLQAEFA
jgi:chromosomal replication initiator protein